MADNVVSSGQIRSGAVISNSILHVASGGTAINTIVNSSPAAEGLSAHYGATVLDTTVNFGGLFMILGDLLLSESGSYKTYVSHTVINSGGRCVVSTLFRGTAKDFEVNQGGQLNVADNATATLIKENGGCVLIGSAVSVTFVPNSFSGVGLTSASATVHNGTVANETAIEAAGHLYVYRGGVVNSTTIRGGALSVRGEMTVYGGEVNSTTINSGGWLYLSGGTAKDTVVNWGCAVYSGGMASGNVVNNTMHVYNGGKAYNNLVNNTLNVYGGGSADVTTVNTFGRINVSSGGTATNIMENGGFVYVESGASVTFTPNSLEGLVLSNTSASLHYATTATGTTVNSGGHLYIFNQGVATSNTVNSSGWIYVLRGGVATSNTINWGLEVYSGGIASENIINNELRVYSSGTANTNTVHRYLNIYSGGTANDNTVYSNGRISVERGGIAKNTVISSGGNFLVFSGGKAEDLVISSGGSLVVSSGGTANNISIYSGCYFTIFNGGTANGFNINSGVGIGIGNTMVDVTVNSGGRATVSSGGLIKNTTINSSGRLVVSSGGRITGQMTFANGAVVSMFDKSVLDFDLTKTSAGAAALLNDCSLIQGSVTYTLTVSGTEADGTYNLAGGAEGFDSITVKNTSGSTLGTLAVGGGTQALDGVKYTLALNGSDLSVSVGDVPETKFLFFTGDFNGDGFDMVAAQDSNAITVFMNGEPWGLGVTLEDGWSIAGVGDFNGDHLDDFLRVNGEGYVVGELSNGNGTFSPQVLNLKGAGWDILGTGDFDADGADDVLIANPTAASETVGLLGYWKGGVEWTLINGYSAEWECVSTGDFNGDGKCDMLWRNSFEGDGGLTYNAYCTWIVDPPAGQSDWRMVSVANPAEWNFLCSGDFNGDGANDIAMINDVGVVGIWGVEDGWLSSWSILSAVTAEWSLAGVADFNGDGTDDIAWYNNDTGLVGCWQIENKELASWQTIVASI